jgi:Helix-turn-helix domain
MRLTQAQPTAVARAVAPDSRVIGVREALAIIEEVGHETPHEELPGLIGALERVKAILFTRLVEVEEAATLLGMSTRALYEHADEHAFTVRRKRRIRFSLVGIQRYLSRCRGDGGRIA